MDKDKPFECWTKERKARYMDAANQLYGNQIGSVIELKSRNKKSENPIPTEDQEQATLCRWMEKVGIAHFAIPNGGYRNQVEAYKFKRCGVKKGIPDLFIPIAHGVYHGLFIELKRKKGGQISDEQKFWIKYLNGNGYLAVIAKGSDEAVQIISNYLELSPDLLPAA